jgi:hypothetical protein
VKSGRPPLAVIFNDVKHCEWNEWDFKLIKAHYILEDWYRDGIPVWWDESDRVTFDAKARTSKSRAAIERAQEADSKKKSKSHGKYYIAEPRVMDDGELPTRKEWAQEQEAKKGIVKQRPMQNHEANILQGRNK